jgi:hypothetical protein
LDEYYEIRFSKLQLVLLCISHILAAGAIYFYLQSPWLTVSGLALVCLSVLHESRSLIRQENISLGVNLRDASIEIRQAGQPYFYTKNKVYQTRWFAILKLVDGRKSRTLILNPDRFSSPRSYQRLRFLLRDLERRNAA